ncbi:hypothetical protein [Sphingomonas sp. LR55]|uniref:hypothetical protein n=1 Tax=Sphingomonas sp. LR55 TaxID=3050231 RepID=UPI002FE0187F
MENAVGGDRTHLADIDAEDRIELGRELGQQVVERVCGVAGLVAEDGADDVAVREIVDPAVADARAFHVAEERHRIVRARFAGDEHAAPCVPA